MLLFSKAYHKSANISTSRKQVLNKDEEISSSSSETTSRNETVIDMTTNLEHVDTISQGSVVVTVKQGKKCVHVLCDDSATIANVDKYSQPFAKVRKIT